MKQVSNWHIQARIKHSTFSQYLLKNPITYFGNVNLHYKDSMGGGGMFTMQCERK